MNGKPQYDQELRAIGQALEAQGISVFEMKNQLGRYIVNGTPEFIPEPATLSLLAIGVLALRRRR